MQVRNTLTTFNVTKSLFGNNVKSFSTSKRTKGAANPIPFGTPDFSVGSHLIPRDVRVGSILKKPNSLFTLRPQSERIKNGNITILHKSPSLQLLTNFLLRRIYLSARKKSLASAETSITSAMWLVHRLKERTTPHNLTFVERGDIPRKIKKTRRKRSFTRHENYVLFVARRASRLLRGGLLFSSSARQSLFAKRCSTYSNLKRKLYSQLSSTAHPKAPKYLSEHYHIGARPLQMRNSRSYLGTPRNYLWQTYFISKILGDIIPQAGKSRAHIIGTKPRCVFSAKSKLYFSNQKIEFTEVRAAYESIAGNLPKFATSLVRSLTLRPVVEFDEINYSDLKISFSPLYPEQQVRRQFPSNFFIQIYDIFLDFYSVFYNFRSFAKIDKHLQRARTPIKYEVKLSLIRKTTIVLFTDIYNHTFFTFSPGILKIGGLPKKQSRRLLTTKIRMMRILQIFLLRANVLAFNVQIYGFSTEFKRLFSSLMQISSDRIRAHAIRRPRAPLLKMYPFQVPFIGFTRPEIHHAVRMKRKRRIKRKIVKRLMRKNGTPI